MQLMNDKIKRNEFGFHSIHYIMPVYVRVEKYFFIRQGLNLRPQDFGCPKLPPRTRDFQP